MTDQPGKEGSPERPHVQAGKGAAQAAIGKLIGDDAEVRKGNAERHKAEATTPADPSTKQE